MMMLLKRVSRWKQWIERKVKDENVPNVHAWLSCWLSCNAGRTRAEWAVSCWQKVGSSRRHVADHAFAIRKNMHAFSSKTPIIRFSCKMRCFRVVWEFDRVYPACQVVVLVLSWYWRSKKEDVVVSVVWVVSEPRENSSCVERIFLFKIRQTFVKCFK